MCVASIVLLGIQGGPAAADTAAAAKEAARPLSTASGTSSPDVNRAQAFGHVGAWRWTSDVNGKGESVTNMRLAAGAPYVVSGTPVTPDLVLSCTRNNTSLYIDWKIALGSANSTRLDIEYTLDDDDSVDASWY